MAFAMLDITWIPSVAFLRMEFERMAEKVGHFEEPLRQIVEEVAAPRIREAFDSGMGPYGAWAPLAEGTLNQKDGDSILIESGALMEGATAVESWNITDTEASLGSPTDYGMFHMTGTGFMPAREWAYITASDEVAMERIMGDWLDKVLA